MARKSKPYLRKQTKNWYCSVNGNRLAKTKKLPSKSSTNWWQIRTLDGAFSTLYTLSQSFLDWSEKNHCVVEMK